MLKTGHKTASERNKVWMAALRQFRNDDEVGSENEKQILNMVKTELQEFYELESPWNDTGKTILNIFKLILRKLAKKNIINLIGELMVEYKFLEVCDRVWDFCHTTKDKQFMFLTCRAYSSVKLVLWNYSNECPSLAEAAYQNKSFLVRCISELDLPELSVNNLIDYKSLMAVKATISILMNMTRHFQSISSLIRCNGGLEKILKYYKHDDIGLKTSVIITVAHCITEKENDKIIAGSDVILFITEQLRRALQSPSYQCYSAIELVTGLDKLAANESNKKSIVDLNVLPLLKKMLNPSSSSDRVQAASSCIWTLSFLEDNKNKISQERGLLEAVHRILSDSKIKFKTRSFCEGITFNIERAQPISEEIQSKTGKDKHIMISYQWNNQPIILKLRDYLNQNGLKTWIDVDKMQGSILEDMAHAVEDAGVIVIAMTEDYKNSNSCRTEAEYAYKLQKPIIPLLLEPGYEPDGWLGALVGTQLYVDLSLKHSFEAKFPDVLKMIRTKMLKQRSLSEITVKDVDGPQTCPNDGKPQNIVSFKSWTVHEVKEWAEKNEIVNLEIFSSGFNGVGLYQFSQLLKRCPEIYYNALRSDYHLEWLEIFLVTEALENLNNS
ncbi:uncharacterized protein LOC143447268 [Clavelina lepadiformis]|uniref:TIR domain-containing protein n=1 Tax=Clavelina lepadiformis TaxID=159417 RepID=A0ABP0FF92_CLALP